MKATKLKSKMLTGIKKAGFSLLTTGTLLTINIKEGKGQWINNITFGSTAPVVQKIGIGTFPTNVSVQAKLHVNQFLLASNPATNGFLFRTDGNVTNDNIWQLYTGSSATVQTERFRLFVPANSNNVVFRAAQPNGSLQFQTVVPLPPPLFVTPVTRMIITDGALGYVGIGQNFLAPQSMLHLHDGNTTIRIRFSNTNTGSTATDGFETGIDANGNATYNQYEALPHIWRAGTGLPEWMRLQHGNNTSPNLAGNVTNGFLGLNEPTPFFHIEVNSPAFTGGELFFGTHPSDVPNSRSGFCNTSSVDAKFLPTVFGSLDASQNFPALQTMANIDGAQDVSSNNNPVHRFLVGKNWKYNQTSIQDIDTIVNRVAFTWQNAGIIKMMMNAQGQIRIGSNLNIPATLPNNRVEITAAVNDPYNSVLAVNGSSGLRFTHLTSLKVPLNNGVNGIDTTKVLSVDQNGDVVLVRAGGGATIGNCTAPTVFPVGVNGAIDLSANNNNFYFLGQGAQGTNGIYMGYVCNTTNPFAKLNVLQKQTTFPSINSFAGFFDNQNNPGIPNLRHIGVFGQTIFPDNADAYHIGGVFRGHGTQWNIGVTGIASNTAVIPPSIAGGSLYIGGLFWTDNKNTPAINFGAYAYATGSNSNIAVYGEVSGSFPTSYAGYFNGDVYHAGALIPSDATLKTHVQNIITPLNIIMQLQPKTFYFDTTSHPTFYLTSKKRYGLIAQDVQPVLPELVSQCFYPGKIDSSGNVIDPAFNFKTLQYDQLIAILIAAMQDQQKQIHHQDSLLQQMSSVLQSCCNNASNSKFTNSTSISLSNNDVIVLNQNVPNPFAEKTTISYHIPEQYTSAQIIFTTSDGRMLKTIDISDKKTYGQITVFADDLSTGIYLYYLMADGKVMETKRMSKE